MNEVSPTYLSVSIVIPNYNGRELLERNLPQVINAASGAELIVVDDASTDGSVPFVRQTYPHIKVIAHASNLRFAEACNSGVTAAQSEIVVLLNNDVVPKVGFLQPLIQVFTDPDVFAAGCKEINQKESSGRAGGRFASGLVEHWRSTDQNGFSTLWVSGGSGAFRKEIWEKLHGMDALFKPAYEEDRDICYRALKRGFKVVFVPQSEVYHQHETTNKTVLGPREMQIASYKNQFIFIWKNITSRNLFKEHLLWLPYHLIVTGWRSHGLIWLGWFRALSNLGEIRKKRAYEHTESTRSDEDIFTIYAGI